MRHMASVFVSVVFVLMSCGSPRSTETLSADATKGTPALGVDYAYAKANLAVDQLNLRADLTDAALMPVRDRLFYSVEIASLINPTAAVLQPRQPVAIDSNSSTGVFLAATGLTPEQVYRYKVWLYYLNDNQQFEQVGEPRWDYGATTAQSRLGTVQMNIVALALHEWDQFERGFTGEGGSVDPDGTRYGASRGEAWCSEYYSWVTGQWLENMTGRDWVGSLRDYFSGYDSMYTGNQLPAQATPGDYLAMWGTQHSGMFLAFERTGNGNFLWTVEGNVGNKTRVLRRAFNTSDFDVGHVVEEQIGGADTPAKAWQPTVEERVKYQNEMRDVPYLNALPLP